MLQDTKIKENADSLIDLLTAQCSDLEKLLALARAEAQAAEQKDFERIMLVVEERARLSERLEVFGRQIAELRSRLGEGAANTALQNPIALHTAEVMTQILKYDSRSNLLLKGARAETGEEIAKLSTGQRRVVAYSREELMGKGYACDRKL